jgi:hypothetical protein
VAGNEVTEGQAEVTEGQALAWWCAHLDELRQAADRGGWRDRLDRQETAVRQGGSVMTACRALHLTIPPKQSPPEHSRGPIDTPTGADLPALGGLEPMAPVGRGSYRCPHNRCARRDSRNSHGRLPVCDLNQDRRPMTPIAAG